MCAVSDNVDSWQCLVTYCLLTSLNPLSYIPHFADGKAKILECYVAFSESTKLGSWQKRIPSITASCSLDYIYFGHCVERDVSQMF